ncbi:MAG: hypothetical protein HZR80_00920 [Candidatus Heimdallarchaeota archaeon]
MTENIIDKFFEGIISDDEEIQILKLLSSELTDDEILEKLLIVGEK